MKNKNFYTFTLLGFILLGVSMLSLKNKSDSGELTQKDQEKVKAILDKSCMECHNTFSDNEKAIEKLDFKAMNDLSKVKKIRAFKGIVESIEEDEMPPKRFLKRYPEKALTHEEEEVLKKWSEAEIQKILNN